MRAARGVSPLGLPGKHLPGEGVHLCRGLSGADGANHEDPSVEYGLGDHEPTGQIALPENSPVS